MTEGEMLATNPHTGEYEDSCKDCLFDYMWYDQYADQVTYRQFEGVREGLKEPILEDTEVDIYPERE